MGRERFATILLVRLLETVILWLSNDQNFWEEIEAGQQPLGPLGLQQVNISITIRKGIESLFMISHAKLLVLI